MDDARDVEGLLLAELPMHEPLTMLLGVAASSICYRKADASRSLQAMSVSETELKQVSDEVDTMMMTYQNEIVTQRKQHQNHPPL